MVVDWFRSISKVKHVTHRLCRYHNAPCPSFVFLSTFNISSGFQYISFSLTGVSIEPRGVTVIPGSTWSLYFPDMRLFMVSNFGPFILVEFPTWRISVSILCVHGLYLLVNWGSRASPLAIAPRHCPLSEGPIASAHYP
jgi:hypothetical protein